MSFLDLYMNKNPLITASDDDSEPVATVFGIPFDATHSYKPGCRKRDPNTGRYSFRRTGRKHQANIFRPWSPVCRRKTARRVECSEVLKTLRQMPYASFLY